MISVSSPTVGNYDKWETQVRAGRIIMNCPAEMDVKAMCAWMERDGDTDEQTKYWRMVEKHMEKVGPLPRLIFHAKDFEARFVAVENALEAINSRDGEEHFAHGGGGLWYSEDPSQKLVRIVRIRGERGNERFRNAPICYSLGSRSANRLAKAMINREFLLLVLGARKTILSEFLEKFCLRALIFGRFFSAMAEELKGLKSPAHDIQDTVLKANPGGHPTEICEIPGVGGINAKQHINCRVLYIPVVGDFPLVDGFFFMESPRRTLVGLQMTTAGAHHTITSTVKQFTEHLSAYFKGWEKLSREMSWEMIYIQHAFSKKISKWHECDCVNPNNKTDA
ncbi:putative retrotransposon hot spot protein (RHS) [Trypanosoma cruzi]|uniref:Putative retrotransposon hot spot protein (RHS) n=1 Tax=Trypanosoma cruzi TaxID=5693 RepID=A0A2V2VDT8_TRYCR|nr:putative retrotransposon hot spot protein (RHS) [Trypanosoma cruzi]